MSQEAPFTGLLEIIGNKKFGFIREFEPTVPKGDNDAFCPPALVNKFNLRSGVLLEGTLKPGRREAWQVAHIDKVMGMDPHEWARCKKFENGRTVYPYEKLNLVRGPRDTTLRVVDLAVPIGKGQRALIVAPPRTGKTVMLHGMAEAISQNHPEVELVALLVDERPEEITDFKRTSQATIFASSNDQEEDNHVRVSTMCHEYTKRLVEQGKDVVLLLDSLTRLGRTFNLYMEGSGRTLSGGLDARAMSIPRKIFGAARKIENGGSLTIIATALVQTGSRMDDVIFEEFKGTGNSEIVLDRIMADKRIFPAVNLRKSGTRNEELLIDNIDQHHQFMRILTSRPPNDAMQALVRHMQTTPTNEALIEGIVSSVSE